ncbi:MAG: hypothetical protein ACK5LC_13240, partial [Coprobacillaceae bacterium]
MDRKLSWFDMYSMATMCSQFLTGGGTLVDFKTATLNLPKTISRIWTVKQVSELPAIKINEKEYSEVLGKDMLSDIAVPVNKLLALGTMFIIPMMNKKEEIVYDVIVDDDSITYLDYYCEDDELKYLIYVRSERIMGIDNKSKMVNMRYEHYIDSSKVYRFEQYYYDNKKIYVNDNDGIKPISNDMMLPFKVDLRINADGYGMPIWANACNLIEDCNKTYHEMMNSMELLRPVVGIPSGLTTASGRGNEDIRTISKYNRMFAVIPGLDELKDWQYFGGTYDPAPYINTLNAQLSDVSLQCGFGRRYLSYDEQGGLKTAKEV